MKTRIGLMGIAIFFAMTVAAQPPLSGVANFYEVSPEIWRGARPTDEGLQQLAERGVRTVLDLEADDAAVSHERERAESIDVRFVSVGMSGFWAPRQASVDAAEAVLADSQNYPIFVHCHHGEDRTGLILGLFRVFHDHWKPADAYQEMLRFGFHPALFLLDRYFKHATDDEG